MRHQYHPRILHRDAMEERTAASVQALMDSHPQMPCLLARANKRDGIINELSINNVILSGPTGFEVESLWEMRGTLDRNLLAIALHDIIVDNFLSEHTEDVLQSTDGLNDDMGYFDLLIMPGVVRAVHPQPYELAGDLATQLATDEIQDKDTRFYNLGFYAAGPWNTAHEGMEVKARVKSMEKVWGNFHREFNERTNHGSFHSIELSSPKLIQMR